MEWMVLLPRSSTLANDVTYNHSIYMYTYLHVVIVNRKES